MTLASILLISVLSTAPQAGDVAPAAAVQSQSAPTPDQPTSTPTQTQNSESPSNQPNAGQGGAQTPANPPQSSSTSAKTAKKPKHKKSTSLNCDTAASQNATLKGTSPNTATDTAGKKPASSVSSGCPPKKTIVRQGSTTEPSIQVVGGAEGTQASDERNTAIQMLETTEGNLKKIEATQLDSDQQEMIKQVRQFMDQSKAANSSGDLDQARTLAWKAQMLSEELLKTQK